MSEATEVQRHALITIANSTAGHVVLPDYMRTDIMEAASTIRDLDLAVDKLIEERDKALKKIDELQDVCGDSADRMVELRKERDDARIRYCRQQAAIVKGMATPEQVANNLHWDCFKENT